MHLKAINSEGRWTAPLGQTYAYVLCMNRVKNVVGCDWWVSVFIVWLGTVSSGVIYYCYSRILNYYDYWLMNFGVPRCRMDVIDTICDARLALTDILTERRRHLLDILRNIEAVTLDDLDNTLQQYCSLRRKVIAAMESLDILEEDYKRCRC